MEVGLGGRQRQLTSFRGPMWRINSERIETQWPISYFSPLALNSEFIRIPSVPAWLLAGFRCLLEILDSFDIGHRVWREANHMIEICLWNLDENGRIRRSDRIADTIPGVSRFKQVVLVLHQGRIEGFL